MTSAAAVSGRRTTRLRAVVVAAGVLYGYALAFLATARAEIAIAGLVLHVLALVTIPLAVRLGRIHGGPWLGQILVVAFALKMVGALLRWGILSEFYGGSADASGYHQRGAAIAGDLRVLDIGGHVVREIPGTGSIDVITGVVYAIFGVSKLGGFFVFTWIGFWGLYFFYRALVTSAPWLDARRYAALVFFLPSLLFWPSSIGKEGWMLFGLGVASFGAAKILAQQSSVGWVWLAAGAVGAALTRPHVAMLVAVAVLGGRAVTRQRETSRLLLARSVVIILIGALSVLVLIQIQARFEDNVAGAVGVGNVLNLAETQTQQGGSTFDAPRASNPLLLPLAVFSVLFRPLIFEVRSPQQLLAAVEGTWLLLLAWRSLRSGSLRFRGLRQRPYEAYALVYVVLFTIAFSAISNFGILARQRTQVLPLFLVVLLGARAGADIERDQEGAVPSSDESVSTEIGGQRPVTHSPVVRSNS